MKKIQADKSWLYQNEEGKGIDGFFEDVLDKIAYNEYVEYFLKTNTGQIPMTFEDWKKKEVLKP